MASHLTTTTVSKPAMAACASLVAGKKSATAVLYHYPCPDGAFAALAAHLYFSAARPHHKTLYFPNTVYSSVRAEQLPLSKIGDVYLLDFVGPRGFVQEISPRVGRVVVLDHHKTALEMFGEVDGEEEGISPVDDNVVKKVIDMSRSGATIAFDYFKRKLEGEVGGDHEAVGEFRRLRRLFEYVEDGDLWKWKLPESKAFYHGLKDRKIEFDYNLNPAVFDQLRSLDLQSVIDLGIKNSSEKERIISEAVEASFEVVLGGAGAGLGRCLAVEVSEKVSELRSELGHQLACKSREMGLKGIGAVAYRVAEIGDDSMVKVSLRGDGNEDTTVVSERFGGGGHRSASSCMMRLEEFEKWRVR